MRAKSEKMETPKGHIERIRKTKFSIGAEEKNPLIEDLHEAVKHLSAELYTKDVHFLMELVQNAEDNQYLEGVDPSLEFIITFSDITCTGAPATLLMFNNEKGFSPKNIESICSVGRSTKKENRKCGYIGEKGIGFKSVFLITAQPYIFSNGYQIRFNEAPCPHCSLGYIVPEWVDENPSLSELQKLYGSGSCLPTTTIILPLKPDKVDPVIQQLSSIHPEVLLFLSKIRRFSVRESNEDPKRNTVSDIAITSETNLVSRKNIDADSFTLYLSAKESGDLPEQQCSYYMWRQKFPVRQENIVERRKEVNELVITLAFPNQERLQRGMSSPGVYAFLPTEMMTNFPFIIQADFLLSSSRETILLDNKWNQGILECVPTAFVNAFLTLVKLSNAPLFNLPRIFDFLPIKSSPFSALNTVRESIKEKLLQEDILPSECHMEQNFFHKPREVVRIMPAFRNILQKSKKQKVSLHNLSSPGCYVIDSSFDTKQYGHILEFLGVQFVNNGWYGNCIRSSNLVMGVGEDDYLELLLFIADNWASSFDGTNMQDIPLLKYEDPDANVSLLSIRACVQRNGGVLLCLSDKFSWLVDCNREFRGVAKCFFMPKNTVAAMNLRSKKETLTNWLSKQLNVDSVSVYDYALVTCQSLNNDRKLIKAYVKFLYLSFSKDHLSVKQVSTLCSDMPIVDNAGYVHVRRNGILVPGKTSHWVKLMSSNPWNRKDYVELSEDYLTPGCFAGNNIDDDRFMNFMKSYLGAADIPYISPPDAGIPAVSAPLTENNTFLLLEWIRQLKAQKDHIPEKFLACIKNNSWLAVTINGYSGFRPPSQSFMISPSMASILKNGAVLVDIPLVNQSFYGSKVLEYKEELKTIGVMFEFGEACEFVGNRLMSLAASSVLRKENVISILNFIRFLRIKMLPLDEFIGSIKHVKWLLTSCGIRAPAECVLLNQSWKIASQISDFPFIDHSFYGDEIFGFEAELHLVGVVISPGKNLKIIIDFLKSPACLTNLSADATLLLLRCMGQSGSSNKLLNALKNTKFLKTNLGYRSPGECYWFDPDWGCLLLVFSGFPLLDVDFYGTGILSFKSELKQLGVVIDFEETARAFSRYFELQASLNSIRKEHVMSFLSCYRKLKVVNKIPKDLKNCIREVKWLRTRLGDYRSPKDCILYGPEWESISPISILPFIDDGNYYGQGIHEFKDELKKLKVVVNFKDGVNLVATGLCIPHDPSGVTPANIFALLELIQLLTKGGLSLDDSLKKKVSGNWLKTYAGYRSPVDCLMFDPSWSSLMEPADGPFIDKEFYGLSNSDYKEELSAIGVIFDIKKACSLLASHIFCQSEFGPILRIFNFLREHNWEPDSKDACNIWIPNGSKNGVWVKPEECVIRDNDGLFNTRLYVLEKHYDDRKLLNFFSGSFGVKLNPSIDDYCTLWKEWELSEQQLSYAECCSFWSCVVRQPTQKKIAACVMKLPVESDDEIFLSNKSDVFIGDDLQLKDLFQQSSEHSIFVWYPQASLPSLSRTKLLEIYKKLGIRKISESVQMKELSLADGFELKPVYPSDAFIGKGLLRLILGFLADPSLEMDAEKRHEVVQCLLKLTVLETSAPIAARYTLTVNPEKILTSDVTKMIRWDKGSSNLYVLKVDKSAGPKSLIEYAINFSEVIANGLLWEMEDHASALSELIKLAYFLNFNEEAIGILMKSKNLQVFKEDEDFLSAAFPSG